MADQQTLEALQKRLQVLEDIEEIRKIYVAYARNLDLGDAAAYAALFARDAKLRLGVINADGREAIEEGAWKVVGGRDGNQAPKTHRTLHLIASPTIEVDGDTATGECVWVAVTAKEGGDPSIPHMGRHLDRFVREDGKWKIKSRKGVLDLGAVMAR